VLDSPDDGPRSKTDNKCHGSVNGPTSDWWIQPGPPTHMHTVCNSNAPTEARHNHCSVIKLMTTSCPGVSGQPGRNPRPMQTQFKCYKDSSVCNNASTPPLGTTTLCCWPGWLAVGRDAKPLIGTSMPGTILVQPVWCGTSSTQIKADSEWDSR
jgi:hypothetical protein